MPNICCAVGCKTNYKSKIKSQSKDLSIHSFPKDHRFKEWYRRVKRDGDHEFTEDKARKSKICSLHFTDDDFVEESVDTNTARKSRRDTKLTRRILRKSAVPSLFPSKQEDNGYHSASHSRSVNSPADSIQLDEDEMQQFVSTYQNDDLIESLEDFMEQLSNEELPEEFQFSPPSPIFYIVDLCGHCPSVSLSVRVNDDLSVEIFIRGELVHPSHYLHLLPNGRITQMVHFINLLQESKQWISKPPQTDPVTSAIMHLKIKADFSKLIGDQEAAETTEFFIDQLSCLQSSFKPRRYSSGLLVTLPFG